MNEASDNSRSEAPGFLSRMSVYAANALRYWEPRRLIYNTVLVLVVAAEFVMTRPQSSVHLSVDSIFSLFILAVLANVAYCAVYAADLFVQFAGLDAPWRTGRVALLIVGCAFGATLAHFFSQAIFLSGLAGFD